MRIRGVYCRFLFHFLASDHCAFQKPGSFLTHSGGGLLIRGLIANRLVLVAATLAAVSSLIFCMPAAPTSAANLSEFWMLLSVSARDFIRFMTRKMPPPAAVGKGFPYMTSKVSQWVSGATFR